MRRNFGGSWFCGGKTLGRVIGTLTRVFVDFVECWTKLGYESFEWKLKSKHDKESLKMTNSTRCRMLLIMTEFGFMFLA